MSACCFFLCVQPLSKMGKGTATPSKPFSTFKLKTFINRDIRSVKRKNGTSSFIEIAKDMCSDETLTEIQQHYISKGYTVDKIIKEDGLKRLDISW